MSNFGQEAADVFCGSSEAPVRVLIADDHPLLLAGIRRSLESRDDIEIVGEAHSGPEVLALIKRRKPRVVLLDLRMPGVTGTECIETITRDWPEITTVVLSANDDRASIAAALAAGASVYIVKSVNTADIGSVLRQASTGSVFHASSGQQRPTATAEEPRERPLLTARERAILEAVASGKTTAAISQDLWVSEHTIKFHLTNIYRKLGVANRAGAVRYAIENGIASA